MGAKLNNVKALYLEGIRDGKYLEVFQKYTGEKYIQHSTGVPDGIEGIGAMFEPFMARYPDRDISILRGIEEDNLVFIHVYQNLNKGEAQWVTMDVFDTDDQDRVIEHWDIIAPFEETSTNPFGLLDGETEVDDLEATNTNKAIIRNFADEVLIGRDFGRWDAFVTDSNFVGHNQATDGSAVELKLLAKTREYLRVHHLIGSGNLIVLYSHVKVHEDELAHFDLFRLLDGKIVEHWDLHEKIGPKETWNNSGKF